MMKILKNIKTLIVMAALMCSMMVLGACNSGSDKNNKIDENGEVTYKVAVKDALGNAYTSGVVVKFLQNGAQIAMQVADDKGVATKKLKAGDYQVEVSFTDGDEGYYYEKENLKVSVEKNEIDALVSYKVGGAGAELNVENESYPSYTVGVGCTYVELDTKHRNYFLFTPTEAGKYEFSVVDGENIEIGYYGAPHYVQSATVVDVKDGKFTVSIKESNIGKNNTGTTVLVIGVDTKDTKNAVLGIERIGEPDYGIEDEPWTIYQKTATLSKYTLPTGATLGEFDITSTTGYNLVYNETDGFYHLDSADGPLVLVRLTEDPKYVSCYKTILDNTGVNKYFFDEKGDFVKKESYSECLLEYIANVDEASGVYPLTKDLEYIIKQNGDYAGWYKRDGNSYLFVDENGNNLAGINDEISWLFMCCYIAK